MTTNTKTTFQKASQADVDFLHNQANPGGAVGGAPVALDPATLVSEPSRKVLGQQITVPATSQSASFRTCSKLAEGDEKQS